MKTAKAPTLLPFPVPAEPEVIGLLWFDGREVLVSVNFGPEPMLKVFEPATAVQLRRDLTSDLKVFADSIAKAESADD